MRLRKNCNLSKLAKADSICCSFEPKKPQTNKSAQKICHDFIVHTNVDVIVIVCLIAWLHAKTAHASETTTTAVDDGSGERGADFDFLEDEFAHDVAEEEIETAYTVLYPWFIEITGVFVYYSLSRWCHQIPFTAIMFLIGFCIGFCVNKFQPRNILLESAYIWTNIEGELIILIFLPGLLYLDSFNIDIHLFLQSFWQLVVFAFPMVLGGTALTALVAYYIFPYGWSFDLCMTFGSILSATDPVAVAVLLNELGAPPRLKMHISGESLMNDGSAVVFYTIFSARFFYEFGLDGIGEEIGWGKGFALFFRLAFGGAAIGLAFGIGAVFVLFHLDRRLSGEDSVIQVVTTISAAYLSFFTSEILAHCSGIIAVLFCGVTVKAFGETLLNDLHLTHHFWEITEHLLNALLFALGGSVWGEIIGDDTYSDDQGRLFARKDWGYLALLYILLMVIRFFLIYSFYPVTKHIGIGTNWKESLFAAYGGLRGAVGIALALSLHAETIHFTSSIQNESAQMSFRTSTAKVFGFTGGIAFLTLFINATTCGPLLIKLGLVTPTETRKKVLENYRQHMIQFTLVEYVKLMTEERFQTVDFTVMKEHIPFFAEISYDKFMIAVQKYKDSSPAKDYVEPSLEHVIPYLYDPETSHPSNAEKVPSGLNDIITDRRSILKSSVRRDSVANIRKNRRRRVATVYDLNEVFDEKEVREERMIFVHILRATYHRLIEHGELESRGFMPYSMFRSLDFASDAASKGMPLNDWDAMQAVSNSWVRPAEKLLHRIFHWKQSLKRKHKFGSFDIDFMEVFVQVRQALAFTRAHESAQKIFKREFVSVGSDSLTAAEKNVLDESKMQMVNADKLLNSLDKDDVQVIKSHYVCQMLLNKSAFYFEKLARRGLVTEREAGQFLEEIEEYIFDVLECREISHKHEMSLDAKKKMISSIPSYMLRGSTNNSKKGGHVEVSGDYTAQPLPV